MLAEAVISGYKDFDLEKSESGAYRSCYLPESLRLDWKKDQLTLDVALKKVDREPVRYLKGGKDLRRAGDSGL